MSAPTSSALQAIGNGQYLALCCECGVQRTFKRMRNRVISEPTGWARDVGQLKCRQCGRVTRHAGVFDYDGDERQQEIALGFAGDFSESEAKRLQDQYRQGLPRNPFLRHLWYVSDQEEAIEYKTRLRVHCGDLIEPPPISDSIPCDAEPRKPKFIRERDLDTEYEDPETGLFWRQVDCVNCLRVSNALRLERRRKHLKVLMTTALGELLDATETKCYDQHIDSLIEALERVHQRNT